jgi:DnaJ-class molecular chaperone
MTSPKQCPRCDGTGIKTWKHKESKHHSSGARTVCPKCDGTRLVRHD